MPQLFKLTFLLFCLSLNYSCLEKVVPQKEPHTPLTKETSSETPSQSDTLQFTSGIRAIFQDRNHNYWIGSLQEGVAMYDGKSFTYFNYKNGLGSNQVLRIQEDPNGVIWFGTDRGVSSYDGTQMTHHTPIKKSEWNKKDDDLWFNAGTKEGIHRYDGRELQFLPFPNPKVINPNNVYSVTSIAKGKHDMLWIGTYAGIFGYDGTSFQLINDETLGFEKEGEYLHIRSVLEDSKGRLWIGNNGIGVLLHEKDSTTNFSSQMGLIHPNSTGQGDASPQGTLEHVFLIAEDRKGNIWFSDRDSGIWKYDGLSMKNYTIKDGLSDDFALSMHENSNGELWFGLGNGDIYQFNGLSFDEVF